jgi:hypothetical protein
MSAAYSALAPIGYDPNNRTQISAGIGTYKGKQAFAIGMYRYSSSSVMWTLGWATTGSENSGRLGITWKLGKSTNYTNPAPQAITPAPVIKAEPKPEVKAEPKPAVVPQPEAAPIENPTDKSQKG